MIAKAMTAAVFDPATKKVEVKHVPIPGIRDTEILVKITSAGLCHSDMMMLDGSFPGSSEPVILGHEGAGMVERIGAEVQGFKPGDRIGFLPVKDCCFTCRGCKVHNLNCEGGQAKLHGFGCDGFFAEYAAVDYRDAIIVPDSMDMKTACVFFCAGVTAFNGINGCDLQPGDWIAIIGCGGLGQMAIQYAKAMGLHVVGLDINDTVLQAAKESGADVIYNSKTNKNYLEELKMVTGGGADAAAVYSASWHAFNDAPKVLRVNGLLMVIGLPTKPLEISAIDLMLGLYRIKGETTGPPWKLPKAIGFTAEHDIAPRAAFFQLDDIHQMIEKMKAGETEKRMVVVF